MEMYKFTNSEKLLKIETAKNRKLLKMERNLKHEQVSHAISSYSCSSREVGAVPSSHFLPLLTILGTDFRPNHVDTSSLSLQYSSQPLLCSLSS